MNKHTALSSNMRYDRMDNYNWKKCPICGKMGKYHPNSGYKHVTWHSREDGLRITQTVYHK